MVRVEEWRPVPGYPGYEASSLGQVRRTFTAKNGRKPGVCLGGQWVKTYRMVNVTLDNRSRDVAIHALVCAAFHGPRPSPEHEVAHWDGVTTHNSPHNLRWATPAGNAADRIRHGRNLSGSRVGNAKLRESDIPVIRAACASGATQRAVAAQFMVSQRTIWRIVNGLGWRSVLHSGEILAKVAREA